MPFFDSNYLKKVSFISNSTLKSYQTKKDWNSYFPLAKQAMDFYFSEHPKDERAFQQIVVHENNYSSIATETDYFIIDIEYDNSDNSRFDLIGIEWPSEASMRKLSKGYEPKLVIFEMKYGDAALTGSSGIKKHYDDINRFRTSPAFTIFYDEMLVLFDQKRKLGLIPSLSYSVNHNIVTKFKDDVDLIFLIANHKPAKSKLHSELKGLTHKNIKYISSNYLGYGLYKKNLIDIDHLF